MAEEELKLIVRVDSAAATQQLARLRNEIATIGAATNMPRLRREFLGIAEPVAVD
jgi:hypothetical protein